jgi:hypothetical protein
MLNKKFTVREREFPVNDVNLKNNRGPNGFHFISLVHYYAGIYPWE